jgi:tape measure domain-containing protein
MAGPLETAFIEIVAQLEVGELEDELSAAVSRAVTRAEGHLKRLEKAGIDAADTIGASLEGLGDKLDVRRALNSLSEVENAAGNAASAVGRLGRVDVGLDTTQSDEAATKLLTDLNELTTSIHALDETNIEPDFAGFQTDLRQMLLRTDELQKSVHDLSGQGISIDTKGAVQRLDTLAKAIGQALRDVEALDGRRLDVSVDDVQIKKLIDDVETAERQLRVLDDLHPRVTATFDDTELVQSVRRSTNKVATEADNTLERAFKRVVAFGIAGLVTRGALQATQQLVSAGIAAAGAIENTEIQLNRFFAQSKNLGETSAAFFKDLRQVALSTPFEFQGLADTSRRILAMGASAKETTDDLTTLADAVSSVGGTQEDIDGVVKALSQLSSKGKVDLQDLRQISERLPSLSRQMQIQGVIDELNRLHPGLNATSADFDQLRKSGLITGAVLRDGIIGAMKQIPGVAGAARAASRSLQGALSNLKDFAQVEFADAFSGLGRLLADQLNAAFGSVTTGAALSPLADAIDKVIKSFGRAAELDLPDILNSAVALAPRIANIATALGQLIHDILPAITSLAGGALTSVTGLVGAFDLLFNALDVFPTGVVEAIGGVITTIVLLKHTVGIDVGAAFAKLAAVALPSLFTIEAGVEGVTLAAAAMEAVLTLGLSIAVFGILSAFSDSAEGARKFAEAVDQASASLKELPDTASAALDFVKKFEDQGNKIELGGLDNFFSRLTSGELAGKIGITETALGGLVEKLAAFGPSLKDVDTHSVEFLNALSSVGLTLDDFNKLSDDAKANLFQLSSEFDLGAKAALGAAVGSQQFALVSDDVTNRIVKSAQATGDYVGALQDLKDANNEAAKSELNKAAAGQDPAVVRQIIANNTAFDKSGKAVTDYVGALQDLHGELQKLSDAYAGLISDAPQVAFIFGALNAGVGDFSNNLVALAAESNKAADSFGAGFAITADEVSALAQRLSDTLGTTVTGAQFTALLAQIKTDTEGFKTSLEGAVTGITDIQFAADNFNLDSFFRQLEFMNLARAQVDDNLNKILDRFGGFGAIAIADLTKAGLSKDQFAEAVSELASGGPEAIGKVITDMSSLGEQDLKDLATRLEAAGLTPDNVNKILGVDAFATSTSDIKNNLSDLGAAIGFAQQGGAAARFGATQNALDAAVGDTGAPAATDTNAAAATAGTTAGDSYGTALNKSVTDATTKMLTDTSNALGQLPDKFTGGLASAFLTAATVGRFGSLAVAGSMLSTGPVFKAVGALAGADFADGLVKGMLSKLKDVFLAGFALSIAAALGARAGAQAHSPSELFARIGDDMAAGISLGVSRSSPAMAAVVGRQIALSAPTVDVRPAGRGGATQSAATSPAGAHTGGALVENMIIQSTDPRESTDEIFRRLDGVSKASGR